jgi:hypothetical protein
VDAQSRPKPPMLRGYLESDESEDVIRIRSGDGTWRFRREDVLNVSDWEGLSDSRDSRPVQVDIRIGAEAEFSQSFRVEFADRPITLPDDPTIFAADEKFDQQIEAWSNDLQFIGGPWPDGGVTRSSCRSTGGYYYLCDSLD